MCPLFGSSAVLFVIIVIDLRSERKDFFLQYPPNSNNNKNAFSSRFERPRSASLHGNSISMAPAGLKKTLRTLSRSRPSSVRYLGSRNRPPNRPPSIEKEVNVGTLKIDSEFAKIKLQLVSIRIKLIMIMMI